MKPAYILVLSILFLLPFSCQSPESSHDAKELSAETHWGYQGAESPEHWAELSQAFIQCAEGHFQSPIDIESYAARGTHNYHLTFDYHASPVDLYNNGHTIQASPEERNTILLNEHSFELRQMHFHEPSEHQLDGIVYPMEMHLVHKDSSGKLAVVGVFIKEGPENKDLSLLWDAFPVHREEHMHPNGRCDLFHLLPEDRTLFHYSGSLTTPPCSEGVEWFVLEQPITLSKTQIQQFKQLYHGNNRPVQRAYAREVEALE